MSRRALPPAAAGLLALAALTAAPRPAAATPWTRDQGSFFAALDYSVISAPSFYGSDGRTIRLPGRYVQHTVGLYAEVGILDRWLTATLDGTLFRQVSIEGQGRARGLGDLRLGLWSGLVTWPLRVSAGLLVGLPTGDPAPDAGGDPAARRVAAMLPTGDGEWDMELVVAAGKSFGGGAWPLRHFVSLRLGYWLRTTPRRVPAGRFAGDYADAFTWNLTAGINAPYPIIERLWIVARLYGIESFAAAGEDDPSGLRNGTAYRSFALEAVVRVWGGLAISGGFAGAFRVRGVPAAAQYRVALSFER